MRKGLCRACTGTMALGQATKLMTARCACMLGARLQKDTGLGKVLGVHSKDGSAVWR